MESKAKGRHIGVRNDFGICRYCGDDYQHHRHGNPYLVDQKK